MRLCDIQKPTVSTGHIKNVLPPNIQPYLDQVTRLAQAGGQGNTGIGWTEMLTQCD